MARTVESDQPQSTISGIAWTAAVEGPDEAKYTINVRRKGVPFPVTGGIGPLLWAISWPLHLAYRLRGNGFLVEVIRSKRHSKPNGLILQYAPFRSFETAVEKAGLVANEMQRAGSSGSPDDS